MRCKMAKISKIRLTGCKYDGLKKEHENSIFDLSKNNKADHTLFTLCNGGGKGVMMQLIFQILLPETRWGKNNGNKVISMFYDQRNILHSFTFHVVLEWVLDTRPEKKLITGIAIKSTVKDTSEEDESKAGLSYFIYTHEYEKNSYFTLENLPLYDSGLKEAIDLDSLDEFISENSRDFTKYSKSNLKKSDNPYYRFLESRGIHRSEWVKLKEINKSEGGSGDYFAGASHNKSIFDKIIIPAISENIKNYNLEDQDNLIEMFKSNLSITKDLPILIKRERDYKQLLLEIKPLIENADIGTRLIERKSRIISQGNDIYFLLKDQETIVNNEIDKWEKELNKSIGLKGQLLYNKDNLIYNRENNELLKKEADIEKLEFKHHEKISQILEEKERKKLYEINKLLYKKKNLETDIINKNREREEIIRLLDLDSKEEEIEDLENEIQIEWDKTEKNFLEIENQYNGYINYTNQLKEENKSLRNKYEDRLKALNKELNKLELREESFNKEKNKLQEKYDDLSLLFPERILENLSSEKENIEESNLKTESNISGYIRGIKEIENDTLRLQYELKKEKDQRENINIKILEQEKTENEISIKIAEQLLEKRELSLLSHSWFNKKLDKLKNNKIEKSKKLEEIQRIIWEKNIDRLLNNGSYFIPNKDILEVKNLIKDLDINVESGTEYLKGLGEKERQEILDSNPGFLYSLVIPNEKDWQIINKNIDENIFLNNMLPIYIRTNMSLKDSKTYKLIRGKAYKLIDQEKYLAWKDAIEEEVLRLTDTEKKLREDIENIYTLIKDIEIISTRQTVLSLSKKLKEKDKKIEEIEEEIRLREEELLSIKTKNEVDQAILVEGKKRLNQLRENIGAIQHYIASLQERENEKVQVKDLEAEIKSINDNIKALREDKDQIIDDQEAIKDSYRNWEVKANNTFAQVREFYKEATYRRVEKTSYSNFNIPDFNIKTAKLKELLKARKIIEENISIKNIKIVEINKDLEFYNKDLNRIQEELERLSPNYINYEYLCLGLDELNIETGKIDRSIKSLESEKSALKTIIDGSKGSIEIMKKQLLEREFNILKSHKKPPIILIEENIGGKINQLEKDLKDNEKYIVSCREIIEKNKGKKVKIEINLSKITTGYDLDESKGKMDKTLKERLENNIHLLVDQWLDRYHDNKIQIRQVSEDGNKLVTAFIKTVEMKIEEAKLREKIKTTVKDTNIRNFNSNLVSFRSMESHFQNELLRLSKDKSKAEEYMKQWTNRAAIHTMRMIEALKSMVSSMVYTNENGYAFPLVKLKGIEKLPKEEGELTGLLEEYFIESITNLLEKEVDISQIEDKVFKDLMGDRIIFSKALRGKYPILMVYKMSEKNEFKYSKARDEYYTTWEAINKGEGDLPEGSGGQTLSVNTFVIMMIMSYKKKHIGNENPSTVLILDNPFGKASAKHVLDPIFEIADKLNFQIISFAAPEIIKVEISERFPVFWELKIENGKITHGGRIFQTN